ncbi:MAG: phosphoglucosamine mutase [Acidobacteria bacterium]|nr:phosphoglucosamine mutase [Acidobacteriota bacterium]
MPRLFGTDGIRGRAFEPPLDEPTVRRLGAALATELGNGGAPRLLMAGDTRASTTRLASWLAEAFQGAGGTVVWAGVLPTPGVSHLLRRGGFTAGVVISASHNPAHDNGIKVLAASGEKVEDTLEAALERRMETLEPASGPGLPVADPSLAAAYLDLVAATHGRPEPLRGLHVVVDAANGAASGLAGRLLDRLGARVTLLASSPDGENINAGCGATVPAHAAQAVLAHGADAGLALDGDADRAILIDEGGRVLDGDDILLVWARALDREGRLRGRRVVATVMSNYGLGKALEASGLGLVRCPVGDRSVWQAIQSQGLVLGGEQSGHIICAHHGVTGDGLVTGSHILAIAAASGPLSSLSDLRRYPQRLINVPVRRTPPLDQEPLIREETARAERLLEGRGRILLRYSGTEPLARVMVEADDAVLTDRLAEQLAEVIASALG